MASDVLSKEDMRKLMSRDEQMYLTIWPYDPREQACLKGDRE